MRLRRTTAVLVAVGLAVAGVLVSVSLARPAHADTTGPDDVVLSHTFKGTSTLYNYAPTAVQSGTTRH